MRRLLDFIGLLISAGILIGLGACLVTVVKLGFDHNPMFMWGVTFTVAFWACVVFSRKFGGR